MSDRTPHNTSDAPREGRTSGSWAGIPRWLQLTAMVGAVIVLLGLVVMLTGGLPSHVAPPGT